MRGRVEDLCQTGIAKRGGVFNIYVEPEAPVANEGPCFMSRTEIAK